MTADAARLAQAFRRHADGSWICVAPITLDHPQGRIEVAAGTRLARNTRFMGVDLAAWLDERIGPK
jgi:hypothetical protein